MAQNETVYAFLTKTYKPNEPIFMSEVRVPGVKESSVRQQFKKLTEEGLLKRFDTGVYYLPAKSMFRSGSVLSVDEVIRRKYLMDGDTPCGYMCGVYLANQLGLTSQVPGAYEICTNKATTDYRETRLANLKVVLRKPYYRVDKDNVTTLQFLDLLREIGEISETEGEELKERLISYMQKKKIRFDDMEPFLRYYPDRIYKNMYEVGLLNGVSS